MSPAIVEAAISEQDWQHAATAIRESRGVLLITHRNPDGDGIGAQLALYDALAGAGIPVSMHNRDGVPRLYRFLAGSERVSAGTHAPHLDDIDLIVSLDAGARSRLGMDDGFFAGRRLINLDHHASNTRFGDINLVDADACATGVLAHALIRHMGLSLSSRAAMAIYVTLLTDTHSFRLSTVTPGVLRLAGEMIEAGAEPGLAARSVYEAQRPEGMDLLRRCLQTLKLRNGEVVRGWIEYYDKNMVRVTREGAPNLFIFKHEIMYITEDPGPKRKTGRSVVFPVSQSSSRERREEGLSDRRTERLTNEKTCPIPPNSPPP